MTTCYLYPNFLLKKNFMLQKLILLSCSTPNFIRWNGKNIISPLWWLRIICACPVLESPSPSLKKSAKERIRRRSPRGHHTATNSSVNALSQKLPFLALGRRNFQFPFLSGRCRYDIPAVPQHDADRVLSDIHRESNPFSWDQNDYFALASRPKMPVCYAFGNRRAFRGIADVAPYLSENAPTTVTSFRGLPPSIHHHRRRWAKIRRSWQVGSRRRLRGWKCNFRQ